MWQDDSSSSVSSKGDEDSPESSGITFEKSSDSTCFTKLHQILRTFRRRDASLKHRLRSIAHDASTISQLTKELPTTLPIVANLRCGRWYVASPSAECVFKSTDGHSFQWNFSSSRLNLHLLPLIFKHQGCVIVDATKKGKLFPDSFNRTVPIWCAVMNQMLTHHRDCSRTDPSDENLSNDAFNFLPPWMPESEEHFTRHQLPFYVNTCSQGTPNLVILFTASPEVFSISSLCFMVLSYVVISRPALQAKLQEALTSPVKPLRPVWVSSSRTSILQAVKFIRDHRSRYSFVVCLALGTCGDEADTLHNSLGFHYIKGAGDDEESWSRRLTPDLFWSHWNVLKHYATEEALATAVDNLININSPPDPTTGTLTYHCCDLQKKVLLGQWNFAPIQSTFSCGDVRDAAVDGTTGFYNDNSRLVLLLRPPTASTAPPIPVVGHACVSILDCPVPRKRNPKPTVWQELLQKVKYTIIKCMPTLFDTDDIRMTIVPWDACSNLAATFVMVAVELMPIYEAKKEITKTDIRAVLASAQPLSGVDRQLLLPKYLMNQLTRCFNSGALDSAGLPETELPSTASPGSQLHVELKTDMEDDTLFDSIFLDIAQQQGSIENFLDVIFSFLQRRTDFFHEMTSTADTIGFPKGRAKEIIQTAFSKHQCIYNRRKKTPTTPVDSLRQPLPVYPETFTNRNQQRCRRKLGSTTELLPHSSVEQKEKIQPATSAAAIGVTEQCTLSSASAKHTTPSEVSSSVGIESSQDARRISTWNGGKTALFWWNQTLSELTLDIPLPKPHPVSKSQIEVLLHSQSLGIYQCQDPKPLSQVVVPERKLFEPLLLNDSTWCIEDGERVLLTLVKEKENWWPCVFDGDQVIDVKKLESVRAFDDFDSQTRASIEKVIHDHQLKQQGIKTPEQLATEETLRKAWNVESSPFKNTPFNPDMVCFKNLLSSSKC